MIHPAFWPKQLESSRERQTHEWFLSQTFRPLDGQFFLLTPGDGLYDLYFMGIASSVSMTCWTREVLLNWSPPPKKKPRDIYQTNFWNLVFHYHSKYYLTNGSNTDYRFPGRILHSWHVFHQTMQSKIGGFSTKICRVFKQLTWLFHLTATQLNITINSQTVHNYSKTICAKCWKLK